MNLGGSLTRQAESDSAVSDSSPHIANIGRMVEVGGKRDEKWKGEGVVKRREKEEREGGGREDEIEN